MACYHPVPAVRCFNGDVRFISRGLADCKDMLLPCGQCVGCRLQYSREWAIRCLDEASCFEQNSFITLTMSESSVAKHGRSLDVGLFQLFMKRLRKEVDPLRVRFFTVVSTLRSLTRIIMRCYLDLISRIGNTGVCLSLVILSCIALSSWSVFGLWAIL